jgi:hypothetical protein
MLNAGVKPHGTYRDHDILYWAVRLESIDHVQRLLKHGANPMLIYTAVRLLYGQQSTRKIRS